MNETAYSLEHPSHFESSTFIARCPTTTTSYHWLCSCPNSNETLKWTRSNGRIQSSHSSLHKQIVGAIWNAHIRFYHKGLVERTRTQAGMRTCMNGLKSVATNWFLSSSSSKLIPGYNYLNNHTSSGIQASKISLRNWLGLWHLCWLMTLTTLTAATE